jgi:hypothetical protein
MGGKRSGFTAAEELAFTTEVDGQCPKCGNLLFFAKRGKKLKRYEIAHIYPLNAKSEEVLELKSEERLSTDLNAFENLIALCVGCHTELDKLRTAEEYRDLVALKKALLQRAEQQEIQRQYQLQEDIRHVIDGLDVVAVPLAGVDLNYDPKKVDDKLDTTMPLPTKNKIKHNVSDYYQYVQMRFAELERESPNVSELISLQVKAFYVRQKALELSQHVIFTNVVNWFVAKTKPKTVEAAEIVASYFVQSCEVFE